ncbi:MAG TPA: Tim44 domain-containing protein [Methyloprofundus sp.]|uniref:Tim44 domain-containing protein n=1 Tax=Methyloprofundus sp. TaxID=2020875 RepID=UPI00183B5DCA|nr:Tim44-like domain-containing protein [Methyloprofundus sp.]HIG65821.1 Tim44 domain-containing protein [Methyloprofundus sp.]HIL78057.1 Tim44 domain-containing protein [Methylococcales bacterium]
MNKLSSFFLTMIITATLSFAGISDAEAKRFGGARSFGSSSKYSKSYSRKASSPTKRTANQQQAYNKNQSARQSMSKRGGLMGLLGGLALGGLLGSLFFGGAFENFNFMDILIFGGIAYLLFKLFAAKAGRPRTSNANNYARSTSHTEPLNSSYQRTNHEPANSAGFDTDIFSKKGQRSDAHSEEKLVEDAIVLPKDFNEQDFLNGAEGAYKMLQSAWDQRDLAEIRSLTTDKVFTEIQSQLQGSTGKNHTDVLNIEAELLEVREIDNGIEAVVLFDTLMREESTAHPEQVREVWTFIKPKNSSQAKWYLDGLQQLEN